MSLSSAGRATIQVMLWLAGLLALYWFGLQGGFFFDDEPNILLAEGVRLEALSFESLRAAFGSRSSGLSARPVSQLSFALNYYLAGFDPFFFKLTNLLIHGGSGALVFLLAREMIGGLYPDQPESQVRRLAGFSAAIWLLHPIQLTVVLYVVQRMTGLAALFTLAAFYCHVRARRQGLRGHGLLLAWGLFWPLACLSKETGVLLPLFVLLWEGVVFRRQQGRLDRFARIYISLVALLSLLALGYILSPAGAWLWAGYGFRPYSAEERLLTEARVLWLYLRMIGLPTLPLFGLHHDDIGLSTGWLTPWSTALAWSGLLALLGLAWGCRRRLPLLSFGLLWFLAGHVLESSFLPLEIAYEHRNYLPLFGISLVMLVPLAQLSSGSGVRHTVVLGVSLAMLSYFALLTGLRSHMYGNEERRSQIEAQFHPDSARSHYEAGLAWSRHAEPGDVMSYVLAQKSFERASSLAPEHKASLLGLLYLECRSGQTSPSSWRRELADRLRRTPFAPGDQTLMYNLKEMALADSLCLRPAEVRALFDAALDNPRMSAPARMALYSWLADYLWLGAGDVTAARAALAQSLALAPAHAGNRLKWVQLLLLSGEAGQARRALAELRRDDYHGEERATFERLQAGLGRLEH